VFYNREDQWGFPRENYADETVPMQPYYVAMRLPGETHDEYILMLPMVPESRGTVRDNMISWLAARRDGSDYGHLFEFAFSKDRLFYGPYQIQAQRHLTAAHESEKQQEDRVLTRQRGLSLGAAQHTQAIYFFKFP
jgi:uncharacterized membrane protein (UPF0182 family)